jgi:hypothetical protein
VFAPKPFDMPSPVSGPQLRLVASDGKLRLDEHHARGQDALGHEFSATRFTRRGRLVITVMSAVAMVTLALALATSVDAAAPRIDHAITVSAGLTLSQIAATQLPALPIQDGEARIQLANGLNTSAVHAGQSLLIPASP